MTFREFADVYRGYRIPRFEIIAHMRRWFVASGAVIVVSIVAMATGLTYSIDFTGGAQISYPAATAVTVQDVQTTLEDFGLEGEVQLVEGPDGTEIAIRTVSLTDVENGDQLRRDLATQAGVPVTDINVEDIGPTWGTQLRRQALISLAIALAAIALYITLRFQWEMAAGAMIALVHDVVITAGVFALTGREVTPETVIALLTILGFSLYDTVVIYDKVAENADSPAMVARMGYRGVVNLSLNQTIMRSINTSLVVLLPILSLLLFGGDTLKDFAFAMFVGVAIGAYSSVFIAAPVLVLVRRDTTVTRPRPRPEPIAVTTAAAGAAAGAAATAATAKQGASARPSPKSRRRPPPKRKRR